MNKEKIDVKNMFQSIYDFPNQMEEAIKIGKNINLSKQYKNINSIVLAGMGGSAVGGDLLSLIFGKYLTVPFFVSRNYTLPNWVNERSLIICSSYSGNTEETLSVFEEANSKKSQIIGITTGGELSSRLKKNNLDELNIPSGLQPRAAVGFSLIPLMFLLKKILNIDIPLESYLANSTKLIFSLREKYSLEDSRNSTFTLAQNIYKKIVVIYGETGRTDKLAIRIKGQLCENSKMLAYTNEIPEMNHNEIVGWENNSIFFDHYAILWLVELESHPRNLERINITQDILKKIKIDQHTINVSGNSFIERVFHFIYFGDWLSYWCAILSESDPTPVTKINFLKSELESRDR